LLVKKEGTGKKKSGRRKGERGRSVKVWCAIILLMGARQVFVKGNFVICGVGKGGTRTKKNVGGETLEGGRKLKGQNQQMCRPKDRKKKRKEEEVLDQILSPGSLTYLWSRGKKKKKKFRGNNMEKKKKKQSAGELKSVFL